MSEQMVLQEETQKESYQETLKLKAKINTLIDKIKNVDSEILERKRVKKTLEDEVKMLQIREKSPGAQPMDSVNFDGPMETFLRDFCLVTKLIFEKNEYIPYSYATSASESFYKVEKSVLDNYVCQYSRTDIKSFLNYAVKLGMLRSESNGKCTYNSGKIVVYYISKAFIDMAAYTSAGVEKEA